MIKPGLVLRLLDIQRVLLRHGLDEVVSSAHLFRPFRFLFYLSPTMWFRRRADGPRGQRIREALEELGPIYVKFGQSVSTRQDVDRARLIRAPLTPGPGRQKKQVANRAKQVCRSNQFVQTVADQYPLNIQQPQYETEPFHPAALPD